MKGGTPSLERSYRDNFRGKESSMLATVATLAAVLQAVFTTACRQAGRLTDFIRRQRHLTAEDFAQTLVFGWIDDPKASVESFAVRLDLSAQALHQRMGGSAQDLFKALLA